MKKILIILLFFVSFPHVYAEEKVQDEYLFPVPSGKVKIVNSYEINGGSSTHQGVKAYYSIDFQLSGKSPKFPDIGETQCFSLGTPILATRGGKVVEIRDPNKGDNGYGYFVRVAYLDNSYTWYAHMIPNTIAVKKGDEVEVGQILGLMGATGKSYGKTCVWEESSITEMVKHVAPHLHLETNSGGKAVLQEPMIGEKVYTNLIEGTYTSATQMIDPTGHWGKFAGLVPYVYNGNYVAMASATNFKPRIQSFSPGVALAGTNQVFTIKGENLPKSLHLSFLGCGDIKWLKQEKTEHQFSCNLAKKAEPRSGFLRFSEKGEIEFNFKINTLDQPEGDIFPEIKDVQIQVTRPGEEVKFKVTGLNLPNDLRPDMENCKNFKYTTSSPTILEFSCQLPHTLKDKNGKRPNGVYRFNTNLVSDSTDFSYLTTFTADYEVQVASMTPAAMVYDKETTIVLTGKNLDLAKGVWVESCKTMQILEQSEKTIKIKCTPYKPAGALSSIMPSALQPDILKNALYEVVLKDEQKGTTLFEKSILVSHLSVDTTLKYDPLEATPSQDQVNTLKANDDMIQYILKAKGNYDEAFLKKVGWKKEANPVGSPLYRPEECKSDLQGKTAHANMKKDCLK